MPSTYFEITTSFRKEVVTLPTHTFDRHIVPNKFGPSLPSVFDIQRAAISPEQVQRSQKDATVVIFIREVGNLGSATWRTVVLARADTEGHRTISTAYNVYNTVAKGEVIWPSDA